VRLPGHQIGVAGKICDAFNTIVAANQRIAQQLEHVGEVVGHQGKTRTLVRFGLSDGAWADMEGSVNALIDDLLWPTTAVTRTVTAVARGDLLQTVPLDVDGRPLKGEFLRSANIVNTMIKQLSIFTSEVTRVAREVGTDGKLGGQANVPGVAGTRKDLTENVNSMASNLTGQVRNIAEVTTAEALELLGSGLKVDVVLTDHAMPSMTGLQLAECIHSRYPGLPIILATGYAELPVDPSTLGIARLAKPCTQHEIAAAIHHAVRSAAPENRVALSGAPT
jgi:CheY-like chemotaxis protein